MPKVSVIVPVYNAAASLAGCVASLCRQTFRDLEIWLIDDGSTDESPQMCEELARRDPRVKMLRADRLGPGGARSAGMEAARGAYIGFVDADDTAEPDMIALLYEAAVAHHCDVASCGFDTREEGRITPEPPLFAEPFTLLADDEIRRELLPRMMAGRDAAVWNKLFRRDFLQSHHINFASDLMWGEDYVFALRAVMAARRVCRLRRVGYHYVIGPGSLSQVDAFTRLRQAKELYNRKAELIGGGREEALAVHNNTWFMHHVGRAVDAALQAGHMDRAVNWAADWRSTAGPVDLRGWAARRRYRMLCSLTPGTAALEALGLRVKSTAPMQAARRFAKRMLGR